GEDIDSTRRPLCVAARDVRCRQRKPRRGCRSLKECAPCEHYHLPFSLLPLRECAQRLRAICYMEMTGGQRKCARPAAVRNVRAEAIVSGSWVRLEARSAALAPIF